MNYPERVTYMQMFSKSFKICFSLLLILMFSFSALAKLGSDEKKRVSNSVEVIEQLISTPDKGIPDDIMNKCECAVVIPSVKKGAFVFGGQYGKGLATCRRQGGGWTAPVFFSLQGGSFGLQIGGQSIDLVLLIMNSKGINYLLDDKFTLGADASVAAGPVGRVASAETDAQLNAEILAYSRTQGIFAGISLKGSVLKPDKSANRALYGQDIKARDILVDGKYDSPADTDPFIEVMKKISPTKK